jgi:hypothetical protein
MSQTELEIREIVAKWIGRNCYKENIAMGGLSHGAISLLVAALIAYCSERDRAVEEAGYRRRIQFHDAVVANGDCTVCRVCGLPLYPAGHGRAVLKESNGRI